MGKLIDRYGRLLRVFVLSAAIILGLSPAQLAAGSGVSSAWGAFIRRPERRFVGVRLAARLISGIVSGRGAIRCDRDEVGGQRFDCVPVPADTLWP